MPTEDLKDDVFHDFDPNSLKYGADELDGRLRGVTRHLGRNMATLFALTKQVRPPRPPTTSIFKGSENKKKDLHEISWFFSNEVTSVFETNGSNFDRTVLNFHVVNIEARRQVFSLFLMSTHTSRQKLATRDSDDRFSTRIRTNVQ